MENKNGMLSLIGKYIYSFSKLVFLAVLVVPQISLAQSNSPPTHPPAGFPIQQEEDNSDNPHKSRQRFERHIKDKYKEISDAVTRVKQTLRGPEGDFYIMGNIVPHKKAEIDLAALPDRHARSRAIAKAFMDDEPALLGIDNPDEIREIGISTDKIGDSDDTYITYRRYINDIEYQGAGMQISVGPKYNISSVSATFGPIPPEVYKATKTKTLTEEDIRVILDNDVPAELKRKYENDETVKTFKKYAIAKPPYIIWDVFYYYYYKVDAVTGKILSKIDPISKNKMPIDSKEDNDSQGNRLPPMPPPVLPHK